MGRKIPGTKHHGVRDPEKQRAVRLKSIKHKINAPPVNADDQQIPKSLQRIADLTQRVKNGDYNKRKKVKTPRPQGAFDRLPSETDRAYMNRVRRHCDVVKHEAAFEKKFGVEVQRNEQGEIENVKKREKDPVEVMMKAIRKEKKDKKQRKRKKKAGVEEETGPRLTKSQKRQAKLRERKHNKEFNKLDDFDHFKDEVGFGEQVHAPPTLTAPKKVKALNEAPRPGRKDLLLKSMLPKGVDKKTIDKTGKRKDLPNAVRRQLERQQEEVIQAYKDLKTRKYGVAQ